MMLQLGLVALGSALGGISRYGVSRLLNPANGFPWGTFGVNVLGSLILGALSGWLAHATGENSWIRPFAIVGFCGGFTTFSTFSNETFRMLDAGHWGLAACYAFGTMAAGLLAVALGYGLSK